MQSIFAAKDYRPRRQEETILHRVVRDNLGDFLQEARLRTGHEEGMPAFVINEFNRFLTCGSLAGGFARFRCESCGHERLVPFSCKRRGLCPSCAGKDVCPPPLWKGRAMADEQDCYQREGRE